MSKPAMPIDDKLYNLKLKSGGYLSVKKDGTGVELVAKPDGSRLQKWRFLEYFQGPPNSYSFECFANGQSYFLNNAPHENAGVVGSYPGVNTHIWQITPQIDGYFHFFSAFSTVQSERYFGTSTSGGALSLQHLDDGSGRQQWLLRSTEPVSDTLNPYLEDEILNLMASCPDMVAVLLSNQCMTESKVENNIFYSNPQNGAQNERAIDELLKAYKYQIDAQSDWPFDLFWSIHIAIARSNPSSKWHKYALTLPKGKQQITSCVTKSWLGTISTGWSNPFACTVYVV
ncbi:hypothetical protein EDC56_2816 [Sinobacterium caligoides]|uniref:Ricin-type beta-trefoil lectin protein n=1 Tax=Sinobacterium caligoides TaxID=933926 RepID=A0A3N2DKG5_9GAMM|nr:hypothetical protein [Sinobacterium caligoides]ROS00179.1 hypothetical protein EDC56_2816 [Sinobacterium caligoides]